MNLQHPLAEYASSNMVDLWGPKWNVVAERQWWLHIVRWMRDNTRVYDHVVRFDDWLAAYEAVLTYVDLDSIAMREMVTRHDVKARIEEFNWLAGTEMPRNLTNPELIHWGMTSADVVDNISLIRMQAALDHLLDCAQRRHTVWVMDRLGDAINGLPLRGLKGPVGTQQDMIDLLGSHQSCIELDEYLAEVYDFNHVLNSIGQVYPRSIDFQVAQHVHGAIQECSNKAPWLTIASGYLNMIASYSGDQWNEGDVSTSVVRRVALPGLFLAADAALNGVIP